MSSRADYLSKYVSDTKASSSKSKKKKKKTRENNVKVINNVEIVDNITSYDNEVEDEDEDLPIKVSGIGLRENKGFKRIDNKEVVVPETNTTSKSNEEIQDVNKGETVYRDLSGRVINISERRKELAKEKEEKEAMKIEAEKINVSDISKLTEKKLEEDLKSIKTFRVLKDDEDYNKLMKSKTRFDDPLFSFDSKNTSVTNSSKSGRFEYDKGISAKNRFNIKSGYFWDGIDRSNGFEDLILEKRQEQMYNKIREKSTASYDEIDIDLD